MILSISRRLAASPRTTLGIGLLFGVILVTTVSTAPPDDPPSESYRPNISSFRLPAKLDFCGEQVPLADPEVHKRMDREFLLNLQWDGQMMLYLKRSGEFFAMYERILREENAPEDLKYISVAESALFQAQSSKGAVGLWQFIPETGRRFGLRVDDFVDERRNPEKSTRAAVRYLKENYTKFRSWALAAAAYNMGEAQTEDDLRFQKGESFYDLYVNEETSRYLFRIVALKELMEHPERYGYYLAKGDYYQPTATRTVTVTDSISDLSAWAIDNRTTYKTVKLLNPWILKRLLPKPSTDAPYAILVPAQ